MDFNDMTWHQQRAAGLHAMPYDIAGYAYKADMYCPDCILRVMRLSWRRRKGESPEAVLDRGAKARGINRADESSFDSGEFAAIIRRENLTPCEFCDGDPSDCDVCGGTGTSDVCGICRATLGA
jgi:hypothetical protein